MYLFNRIYGHSRRGPDVHVLYCYLQNIGYMVNRLYGQSDIWTPRPRSRFALFIYMGTGYMVNRIYGHSRRGLHFSFADLRNACFFFFVLSSFSPNSLVAKT